MELSPKHKAFAAIGVILGTFLAAIEATAVATAMPTATSSLGGIALIHYVFAAYSLAIVLTIPTWGRLSDIWGLRASYLAGCSAFLFGSVLCGFSQNVYQLIIFRFVQGIGAGSIFPVAMTTLGVIYSHEKRAKMQIYLSLVWAFASVIGPPLGALLTHALSWRWVFYLNLPAGIVSLFLVEYGLAKFLEIKDKIKRPFDHKGSMLLSLVIFILIAAIAVDRQGKLYFGWSGFFGFTFVAFASSFLPFSPFHVLKNPVFIRTGTSNFFICMAMFGSLAFVPLFCQAGLGQTVGGAGRTLTISTFGWVISSIVATRAYLRVSLRTLSRIGIILMVLSFGYLGFRLNSITANVFRMSLLVMGLGIGICFAPMLIGLQSVLPRQDMGTGTAGLQFLRNLGGLMGVAVMGTLLAITWDKSAYAAGSAATAASQMVARHAMSKVFLMDTLISLAGLFCVWSLPHTMLTNGNGNGENSKKL
ncbi:MAG: MFS transporter [Elusimicrobia bacterium]|nr:MFS transporter [Elusimicrobiota bacterium]